MSTVVQKSLRNKASEATLASIIVVYKAKSGSWRGFVQPYDVTTEAPTKAKALKALREMAEVYEDGLKKYDYPMHLASKHLSDPEDNEVFNNLALRSIAKKGKITGSNYYVEAKTISA